MRPKKRASIIWEEGWGEYHPRVDSFVKLNSVEVLFSKDLLLASQGLGFMPLGFIRFYAVRSPLP